jgi:L-alanine-DL-glutamate epimerase-like enolase superfamily enzyme
MMPGECSDSCVSRQQRRESPPCVVTGSAHWLEWQDWADPILAETFVLDHGRLIAPDRPGQGITRDEAAVARYAT